MLTPTPYVMRYETGHLFEITDSEGNVVLRQRGGMMPSRQDAAFIIAACNSYGRERKKIDDLTYALDRIASMTDRDGNPIEMHIDELRAIAKTILSKESAA